MTYDKAIEQLETLIQEMEDAEMLSIEAYKNKAKEAKKLLDFCKKELVTIEKEMQSINEQEWFILFQMACDSSIKNG